jgi:hypothetical protein
MTCPVYQLSLAVAQQLKRMYPPVPARVSYGAEIFQDQVPDDPWVEFATDDETGDTFEAPVTGGSEWKGKLQRTPRGKETVGVLVRISAASTKTGAGEWDHKGEVRELARNVWCAIFVCSHAARMPITDGRGAFLKPPDGAPLEIGARYLLRFGLQGAIEETTGIKAGSPLVPIITTKAIRNGVEEISSGPGP